MRLRAPIAVAAYGGGVDRPALRLAALASAAVPGLNPASVERADPSEGGDFDVAFVQDREHRRWVVRAPVSPSAAAGAEQVAPLLALLARRVPFSVPLTKGIATDRTGLPTRIHPYLPGQDLDFAALPGGATITADVGRAIAMVHNVDRALFEEAGVPTYDAEAYRQRHLAELDRGASTGRVPTALLSRWETALEDVALWRFAPTPIHGSMGPTRLLAIDEEPPAGGAGQIRGILGWEHAKVADPADDFAAVVAHCRPDAVDTVLEAYAHTRVDRPDPHLLVRARLAGELGLLSGLMAALVAEDAEAVARRARDLARLDENVHDIRDAAHQADDWSLSPISTRPTVSPPPMMIEEDEDDDIPCLEDATTSESSAPRRAHDDPDGTTAVDTDSVDSERHSASGDSADPRDRSHRPDQAPSGDDGRTEDEATEGGSAPGAGTGSTSPTAG